MIGDLSESVNRAKPATSVLPGALAFVVDSYEKNDGHARPHKYKLPARSSSSHKTSSSVVTQTKPTANIHTIQTPNSTDSNNGE